MDPELKLLSLAELFFRPPLSATAFSSTTRGILTSPHCATVASESTGQINGLRYSW
jgi:hypothetical protein